MPHGAALHEDDWMMTVLARHRRGQAQDESRLRPTDHLFEAVRRQVVTFIDDHLPVIGDAIVHDIFADEALNDRHIEQPGRLVAAAANAADRLRREVEKRRQPFDPLVQELAPMHEHQRIDAALGDQPGSDDCLAERRRGGQDTSVVLQHRLGRELLLWSQLALKGGLQRLPAETLVTDDRANIQVGQDLTNVFETSAWQADVLWMFFSATDDPWLVVGRQAHRLGLVELRILERGDTQQSVSKTRSQAVFGDVDLVSEDQFKRTRKLAGNRWLRPATRWRRGPRCRFVILRRRKAHAKDAPTSIGVARDRFQMRALDALYGREKCPLVAVRHCLVVKEHTVAVPSGVLLQRQRDQIAKSSVGQRVLIREESIVRVEPDIRPALHGLRQDVGADFPRERRRHGLFEQQPNVPAAAGA